MSQGHLLAGRYRLDRVVGSGGMGEVWRATDTELGRVVAVKRATLDRSDLRREARIAAGVRHPNVVTLHDSVLEGDDRWLVMEYVPARSLADILRQNGPLPVAEVARIGAQVAAAVAAVHAAGVVHRDIKPGNILVDDDGHAKLTDFGVSRQVWTEVTATESAMVAGTPAYLAPEVAQGQEPAPPSDVFALGATLFAAVQGDPPYGRANPLVVLRRAADGQVPVPTRAGPLAPVLAALMQRYPAQRPDAATARRLLTEVARDGTTSPTPLPAVAPAAERSGRRRALPIAVGVAAVAVVAAAALVVPKLGGNRVPGTPTAASTGGPAAPAGPGTVGQVRDANMCALLDPARFADFGDPVVNADRGNFNLCMLEVRTPEGLTRAEVSARVEMFPDSSAERAPRRTVGRITVQQPAADNSDCYRTLVLADQKYVVIDVYDNHHGPALDVCALADTATSTAVDRLNAAQVPRRNPPLPSNSLNWIDSCSLLDDRALRTVPGINPPDTQLGVGGWICEWSDPDDKNRVVLKYDRSRLLTSDDGAPLVVGGHSAVVVPHDDGDDSCAVDLTYRIYPTPAGQRAEFLRVIRHGVAATDQLCASATALATDAAGHLPRS